MSKRFDRLVGIYYTARLFHSGQWSRGYRLLSRIDLTLKGQADRLKPNDEWSEARNWAAYYIRRARTEKREF